MYAGVFLTARARDSLPFLINSMDEALNGNDLDVKFKKLFEFQIEINV